MVMLRMCFLPYFLLYFVAIGCDTASPLVENERVRHATISDCPSSIEKRRVSVTCKLQAKLTQEIGECKAGERRSGRNHREPETTAWARHGDLRQWRPGLPACATWPG